MKIDIPYGKDGRMPLEISECNIAEVVYPNRVDVGDECRTLENAIGRPVGGKSIEQFLSGAKNVLVVVNDATRPTPTARILGCIYNELKKLESASVRYISAVGSHRAPTETEHREFFGEYYDEIRSRIIVHDSKKESDMVSFGVSRFGTEIRMNRAVAEADRIIIINSVEPHYFAGYTGGRKSLFPGLASYRSIEQNHKRALDKKAATFALEGNPVHEDMDDIIAQLGKEIFSILVVLDAHHRIYSAFAGDHVESFRAAVRKANEVFAVKIKSRADIVVTIAPYPTDIDLYQSQKSLDNGKNALSDNGIIILVSECRDGIGNETFYKLLGFSKDPRDIFAELEKGYKLGYHKAAKMAEIMLGNRIWAVSSLTPDVLEMISIRHFKDVQSAVDAALEEKGMNAKALLLMDGNLTVPMLEQTRK